MRFAGLLTALAALLATTGCFEMKTTYTINPDGSGKAVIDYIAPLIAARKNIMQGNDDAPPQEQLQDAARAIMAGCEGVDAWDNVSFKFTKEGKLHFHGTAYFPDYNKFKFFNASKGESGKTQFTKTGDSLKLELVSSKTEKKKKTSLTPQEKLVGKISYQNAKPMMSVALGGMKISETFVLPGKPTTIKGFVKSPSGALTRSFDGKKLLATLDKLAKQGDFENMDLANMKNQNIVAMVSGMDASAVYAPPFKPLFNYKKAVAAAKKTWKKKAKKLFPDGAAPGGKVAEPTKKAAAETVAAGKAGETIMTSATYAPPVPKNMKSGLPFLQENQLKLTIVQKLPFKASTATEGKVTAAVAGDGENILSTREWDRKISFPKLSQDGQSVMMDIKLKPPKNPSSGIKILEGEVKCLINTGKKTVDLGMVTLKKGEKGKALGATISAAGGKGTQGLMIMGDDKGGFGLKLDVSKENVIEIVFYDANKKPVDISKGGCFYSNNQCTYSFGSKNKLPAKIGIKVKLYAESAEKIVHFKLENTDLFGKGKK